MRDAFCRPEILCNRSSGGPAPAASRAVSVYPFLARQALATNPDTLSAVLFDLSAASDRILSFLTPSSTVRQRSSKRVGGCVRQLAPGLHCLRFNSSTCIKDPNGSVIALSRLSRPCRTDGRSPERSRSAKTQEVNWLDSTSGCNTGLLEQE